MRLIRLLAILSLVFEIAGCATPAPSLPQPRPDSGALVISVALQPVLGSPYRAQVAYFARLDDSAQPLAIHASDFHKDGRVYLLNAPPGRYRAIAASFRAGLFGPGDNYVTYFPQEVIEGTTVTVRPGALVAVGSVAVRLHIGLCPDTGDDMQLRFASMLAPGVPKCGLGGMLLHELGTNIAFVGAHPIKAGPSTYHYRGSLIDVQRDAQAREALLLEARQDLAGTGWAAAPP